MSVFFRRISDCRASFRILPFYKTMCTAFFRPAARSVLLLLLLLVCPITRALAVESDLGQSVSVDSSLERPVKSGTSEDRSDTEVRAHTQESKPLGQGDSKDSKDRDSEKAFRDTSVGSLESDPEVESSIQNSLQPPSDSAVGERKITVGLALGGGGTRGAAHIGVIRALEKEGIKVDMIAGTSIGAIVGSLYCAGVPIADIERILRSKAFRSSYNTVPIWLRVTLIPFFLIPHVFGHSHYDGLYRGNRFAAFINHRMPDGIRNIEDLKIPFAAVASSLMDGEAHAIREGDIGRAVQASSAIPVLRRPVEIGEHLYVDGGITDNLPVRLLREMGADLIVAVDIDETFANSKKKQFKKIGSVGNRVISIILSQGDSHEQKHADVVIHPMVDDIKILSTKERDIIRAIQSGEDEATKSVSLINEKLRERRLARPSVAPRQSQ